LYRYISPEEISIGKFDRLRQNDTTTSQSQAETVISSLRRCYWSAIYLKKKKIRIGFLFSQYFR